MKRIILAAAVLAVLCFAANTLLSEASEKQPPSDCSRTYVFREKDGFVVCCEKGEDEPFLVTKVRVSELTPADRVMLASGVEVHGARAMSRALEDYAS